MQNQKYAILFRSFPSAAASNIALNSYKGFNTPNGKLTYACKDALQCMHIKRFLSKYSKYIVILRLDLFKSHYTMHSKTLLMHGL